MKIVFISHASSGINFFPQLEEKLVQEISAFDSEQVWVASIDDLPAAAKEASVDADLIFVVGLFETPDFKVEAAFSKLIDVELSSSVKILRYFDEYTSDNLSEDQLLAEKDAFADDAFALIVDSLYQSQNLNPDNHD